MRPDLLASLQGLSDVELEARVHDLVARERDASVLLVAHLAELDTREVHFRAGHGSLFAYCRDALGLSEQEAYNRIAVARAARRFPVILDMLEGGAVSLTTVRLLGPHLTPDNHSRVLDSARGKTRVQVEEIAAALWPRPDAPSFVRKLPRVKGLAAAWIDSSRSAHPASSPSAPPSSSSAPGSSSACPSLSPFGAPASSSAPAPGTPSSLANPLSAADPAWPQASSPQDAADAVDAAARARSQLALTQRSADVMPLSPDRYRVQVTIGGDTLEKLKLAKDLLRHAVPSGDEAVILDRALTALLEDLAQKRFAAAEQPRASSGGVSGSRHIPADVRRTVWTRDRGCCAFVGRSGRRCSDRGFLEFHHVQPYALGGESTAANIQLRCRSHNAYEARMYFARGNGHDGAASVREAKACYGPAVDETRCIQAGRPSPSTRFRPSRASRQSRGPAP
jgi:hypothetical protein